MADRAENNKVPARNAANSDQEPQRSRGPDDRPAPPHRDEMNRKTAPGRDAAARSSPAPVANRITATESPTKKACNGLLQQNRPSPDARWSTNELRDWPVDGRRRSDHISKDHFFRENVRRAREPPKCTSIFS